MFKIHTDSVKGLNKYIYNHNSVFKNEDDVSGDQIWHTELLTWVSQWWTPLSKILNKQSSLSPLTWCALLKLVCTKIMPWTVYVDKQIIKTGFMP